MTVKSIRPSKTRIEKRRWKCECITLHSYPAYVTADSWHVVMHICKCGLEHLNEPLLAPELEKKKSR